MAAANIIKIEKAFLTTGIVLLVACLVALFYTSLAMGITLPGRAGTIDPAALRTTAPFDEPGIRQTGPNSYEVVVIGYAWGYTPSTIEVPAGAEITFVSTSRDVLHGLAVEGTRVNVMLIPGQVSRVVHTFREPNEHLLICHEFCGLAHHAMFGRVRVVAPGDFQIPAPNEPPPPPLDPADDSDEPAEVNDGDLASDAEPTASA